MHNIPTLLNNWVEQRTQGNQAYLTLASLAILSSIILFIPFWITGDFDTVFRQWDGPNYAYVAKTLYDIPVDHPLTPYGTTQAYFACHLPIYPMTIRLFSFMGYNNAMIFTTLLYTVLATLTFYQLLKETKAVESPVWSAFISLFIPARYLLTHSIGATESTFLFFTFASLLSYHRGHYVLAFFFGGLMSITRIVGILIGGAYFIMLIKDGKWKQLPWLLIGAVPLLLTFTFHYYQFGDFFAYFSWNNSLIHSIPADIFKYYATTGDAQSAEFYLVMYGLYGCGVALLWRKQLFFWYAAIMYTFCLFIFHQDVSRYLIPIAPFALVIAYDQILTRKEIRIVFIPMLVLVYIYVYNMMHHNLIVEWVFENLQKVLAQ